MAQYAWTLDGGRLIDVLALSLEDWAHLRGVSLICRGLTKEKEPCDTVLFRRNESNRARRHFYHKGGQPGSCTNTKHESESDEHRTLKHMVADAFNTVKGIEATTELSLTDGDGTPIRVDAAATRGHAGPVSLAEIQLSSEPPEDVWTRIWQRRSVLGLKRDGWARTTPWMTTRAFGSWYGRVPALYLSEDGQRITDGVFSRLGDATLAPDYTKPPVALDLDEWAALTINGALIQYGGPYDPDICWIDNRRTIKPKRGKRRKPAIRDDTPGPFRAPECQQELPPGSVLLAGEVGPGLWKLPADLNALGGSMSGGPQRPPSREPYPIQLIGGPYNGAILSVWSANEKYFSVGGIRYAIDDRPAGLITYRFEA